MKGLSKKEEDLGSVNEGIQHQKDKGNPETAAKWKPRQQPVQSGEVRRF